MKWKIITDSGSNIREMNDLPEDIAFDIVPLILTMNDEQFLDNAEIDTEEVTKKMEEADNPSTACPAPGVYAEKFQGADHVICFTISSEVSGSYNSASLAKEISLENNPEAEIHIFDSKSAGGEMDLLIEKTVELIKELDNFEDVLKAIEEYHKHTFVGYMLQSIDNLVKNGRVNKVLGSLVGLLNINILGIRSENGEIEMSDRVRGEKRAIKRFIEDMMDNGMNGQKIEIGHVNNLELANELAEKIKNKFPSANINIRPNSGLCSFYAEDDGLIVGFEKD